MSCIVEGCKNTKHFCKGLRFFSLPKVEQVRNKWLNICKSKDKLPKNPLVCSAHFTPNQMLHNNNKVRLRRDAIPTLLDDVIIRQSKEERKRPHFELSSGETCEERCGEIFITLNRLLIFQCTLCNCEYGSFLFFLDHLTAQHYDNIKKKLLLEIENQAELETQQCPEMKSEKSDSCNSKKAERRKENANNRETAEGNFVQINDFDSEHMKPQLRVLSEKDPLQDNESMKMENMPEVVTNFDLLCTKGEEHMKEQQSAAIEGNSSQQLCCNDDIYSCDNCGKIFDSQKKLERHSEKHSDQRTHVCKVCNFAFKSKSHMKSHMIRHTGEKNFSCGICQKKFFNNTEAKEHRRTHTGERPFVCSRCGLAFATSGALCLHERKHSDIPPYICNHCGKGYYGKSQLKYHMVMHTKERPFTCPVCSATFPRRKSLLRHTKTHNKNS